MNDAEAVKFKYEIDYTKALAGCLQIVSAEQKMVDTTRQLDTEAGRTQKTMEGFGKVAGDIGKIGLGIIGASSAMEILNKAIGVGIKEFEDLHRKEDEAFAAHLSRTKTLIQTIGETMGTEFIEPMDRAFQEMFKRVPNLTAQLGTDIFGAYMRARPEARPEESLVTTEMLGPLAQKDRVGLAKLAGELKEIYPAMEQEDILDMAIGLRQRAGKHKDELSEAMKGVYQLTQWGVTGDEGLAVLMGMLKTEQQPRAMTELVKVIANEDLYKVQGYSQKYGMKKVGHRFEKLTDEEQLKLSLQQKEGETRETAAARRYRWILTNPEEAQEFFGEKLIKTLPALKGGEITAGLRDISGMRAEDLYAREMAAGKESPAVQEALRDEKVTAGGEHLLTTANIHVRMAGETRKLLQTYLPKMTWLGKTETDLMMKIPEIVEFFGMGDRYKTQMALIKEEQERFAPTIMEKGFRPGSVEMGMPLPVFETGRMVRNPEYNPAAVEGFSDLIKKMEEIKEAYPDNTESMDKNTKAIEAQTEALNNLTTVINSGRMVNREVRTGAMD